MIYIYIHMVHIQTKPNKNQTKNTSLKTCSATLGWIVHSLCFHCQLWKCVHSWLKSWWMDPFSPILPRNHQPGLPEGGLMPKASLRRCLNGSEATAGNQKSTSTEMRHLRNKWAIQKKQTTAKLDWWCGNSVESSAANVRMGRMQRGQEVPIQW